ncbi:unnamed protein product [Blepharisma stoltei]|uniref:Uncharacterized protein n=1 Tax=Blepharisma stoltei TaxID=1481888 RepID=A0AAU9K4R0_9CILI|nr:unnamed protein product [Blepharisma stoltei]
MVDQLNPNTRRNPWYIFWEPKIIPTPPEPSEGHTIIHSRSNCARFYFDPIINHNPLLFGRIDPQTYLIIIQTANRCVKSSWIKYMFFKIIILIVLFLFSLDLLLSLIFFDILALVDICIIIISAFAMREVGRQFMIRMKKNELIMNRELQEAADQCLRDTGVRVTAGDYCHWLNFYSINYRGFEAQAQVGFQAAEGVPVQPYQPPQLQPQGQPNQAGQQENLPVPQNNIGQSEVNPQIPPHVPRYQQFPSGGVI